MNSYQIGENAGVVWRALHDRKHERNVFYPLFGSPPNDSLQIPWILRSFFAGLCVSLCSLRWNAGKIQESSVSIFRGMAVITVC